MRINRRALTSKEPDDLPLWVANLRKTKLTKNGFSQETMRDVNGVAYRPYYGLGLTVYRFDLRTDRGITISHEYVRAHNPKQALNKIKELWPSVKGLRLI